MDVNLNIDIIAVYKNRLFKTRRAEIKIVPHFSSSGTRSLLSVLTVQLSDLQTFRIFNNHNSNNNHKNNNIFTHSMQHSPS